MEYGPILNIAACSYFDGVVVAPNDDVKPYTHILFQLDIADNGGIGSDEVCLIAVRCDVVDRIQHLNYSLRPIPDLQLLVLLV